MQEFTKNGCKNGPSRAVNKFGGYVRANHDDAPRELPTDLSPGRRRTCRGRGLAGGQLGPSAARLHRPARHVEDLRLDRYDGLIFALGDGWSMWSRSDGCDSLGVHVRQTAGGDLPHVSAVCAVTVMRAQFGFAPRGGLRCHRRADQAVGRRRGF